MNQDNDDELGFGNHTARLQNSSNHSSKMSNTSSKSSDEIKEQLKRLAGRGARNS